MSKIVNLYLLNIRKFTCFIFVNLNCCFSKWQAISKHKPVITKICVLLASLYNVFNDSKTPFGIGSTLQLLLVLGLVMVYILPFNFVVKVLLIFKVLFLKSISFQLRAVHSPCLKPKKYNT